MGGDNTLAESVRPSPSSGEPTIVCRPASTSVCSSRRVPTKVPRRSYPQTFPRRSAGGGVCGCGCNEGSSCGCGCNAQSSCASVVGACGCSLHPARSKSPVRNRSNFPRSIEPCREFVGLASIATPRTPASSARRSVLSPRAPSLHRFSGIRVPVACHPRRLSRRATGTWEPSPSTKITEELPLPGGLPDDSAT